MSNCYYGHMVNNNNKTESACAREIMSELYQTCETLRPKIFRLAAEADENDPVIGKFGIYILFTALF